MIAAARAVLDAADDPELERFGHGTTVATNALLERKGARTAFVTTEGFEHLLHLRRQNRAHLYRLELDHPEPLVPLERCVGVRERMGPEGVVTPLDLTSLPAVDAEAIAVCLLFAFRDPSHERAVAEELRRRRPDAHVVASHEVAPEFREYERASTTAADAYLGPVVATLPPRAPRRVSSRVAARAARDALLGRRRHDRRGGRAPGADPRLGPRGRRDGRGADRRPGRGRERDRLRHGRHLDGRLPDRRRPGRARGGAGGGRLPGACPDGRHPHGRRGRRLDRLARCGRSAAGRAAQRRRGARSGLLRARRRRSPR